jgi:hypothetical protein
MNVEFVSALEMLPVPKADALTPERVAGTRCVWCGKGVSVILGPRLSVIDAGLERWQPRACASCTRREAARVHAVHLTTCPRCTHWDYCPDSRALYNLANSQPTGLIREG